MCSLKNKWIYNWSKQWPEQVKYDISYYGPVMKWSLIIKNLLYATIHAHCKKLCVIYSRVPINRFLWEQNISNVNTEDCICN